MQQEASTILQEKSLGPLTISILVHVLTLHFKNSIYSVSDCHKNIVELSEQQNFANFLNTNTCCDACIGCIWEISALLGFHMCIFVNVILFQKVGVLCFY